MDENGENRGGYHCREHFLNGMFESIRATRNYNMAEAARLSRQMIVETLLLVKNVSFEVAIKEKVIEKITVAVPPVNE